MSTLAKSFQAAPRKRIAGFSLVELFVCVAIIGILLSQVVPALQQLVIRQRVELVAQTLMTNLQQARSEAVHRSDAVHLGFSQHPQGSCYIMHSGEAGQCTCADDGKAVCVADSKLLKLEWAPNEKHVAIHSNVSKMSFQARQGAVTSTGRIDIASDNGATIRHIVSIAGRVRTCSPNGSFKRFPAC